MRASVLDFEQANQSMSLSSSVRSDSALLLSADVTICFINILSTCHHLPERISMLLCSNTSMVNHEIDEYDTTFPELSDAPLRLFNRNFSQSV